MNPIQMICMSLQSAPINGRLDNGPSHALKSLLKEGAARPSIWDLLPHRVSCVEINTCHDIDTDTLQKQTFKDARFYFYGVNEPLVLDSMPAHPAFPTFPKQLFEQSNGQLKVKSNPYLTGDDETVFNQTIAMYLVLDSLVGFNGLEKPIKSVLLDNDNQEVKIEHTDELNDKILSDIEESISSNFSSNKEAYITHFIVNFMPDMSQKTEHGFKKIMHDGQPAIQNAFTPVDWSTEDKTKFLSELLHELSMVPMDDNCPAYITHETRMTRYVRTILEDILPITMPLTKDVHGMDCDSFESFYQTTQGLRIIETYRNKLLDALKSTGMNLGVLLNSLNSIRSSKGAH